MKSHFVFVISAMLIFQAASPAMIIDSVNADMEPWLPDPWFPGMVKLSEAGWLYTPSFSYTLTGVQTKFGPSWLPGSLVRTVTVEVYDDHPLSGGSLLRSAAFDAIVPAVFCGGSFNSLELTAGEDYFIGFRNLLNLPFNVASAGELLPGYFGHENEGSYEQPLGLLSLYGLSSCPIIRFEGVPEPATLLLLGLGGLVLRRKR